MNNIAKLKAKQQRFCEEYLIDLNGTQAAIRAGYSPDTAAEIASENLTKPNIRTCIDKAIAERSKRTGVNQDRVIRELAKLAFIKADDLIDTNTATVKADANEDDLAAIASVKVKIMPGEYGDGEEHEIKLCDKLKALELLGKHLGMFTDKLQISGSGVVQIVDDIPTNIKGAT